MHLRRFEAGDLPAVQELFAGSIRTVCRGDYTPAQLEAWANPVSYTHLAVWRSE